MSTASCPVITVGPVAPNAAMANAIAIRWSPTRRPCPTQPRAAVDTKTIRRLVDTCAKRPESGSEHGDPVAFLGAEFGSAADVAPLSEDAKRGERGQFIDQGRDLFGCDFNRA